MCRGSGKKGYYNMVIRDPMVHSLSAMGVKQKHFMYHNPQGNFYALDVYAKDMKEAKEKVREELGVKRLNDRISIWEKKFDAKGTTEQIKIGDYVRTEGSFVPYEGKVTRFDGNYIVIEKDGIEYRLPEYLFKKKKLDAKSDWKKENNYYYKKNSDTYLRLDHNNRMVNGKIKKVYEVFLWRDQYNKGFVGGMFITKSDAIKYINSYMS